MNTEIPAGLADGIDPGAITIPQVKIELLEEAAKAIKDDGQDVSDFGHDIKSTWGGLTGVYSAPEDQTLFSAIDPVATKGDDVHSAATTVGDALMTFAEDVRPILRRWHSLKGDAEDMQAHIGDNEDWRQDEEKVEEFNQLNNDLLKAQNDFMAAERECANKITALFGGTTFVATEPGEEGSAGKGEQAYGYGEAPQDVPTPWAIPQEHDAPWYTDVYAAGVDLTWGSVKDGLGMVGFHDGQGNWTLDRDEVAANTRRYWGDAIAGAAMLAGYSEGDWSWGTAGTAWKEAAHSMVPWREWGDRPGYVITQSVVNLGSIALGMGLTISGYGAPAGGALLAWRGTRVMRALGKVGDLAPDSGAPGGGHGNGNGSGSSDDGDGSGDRPDLELEPDDSGRRDGPPTTEEIQRELGDWESIATEIGWEETLQQAADLSELSEQRQPALVGAPDGDLEINANADGPDNPPTTKPVPPLLDSPSTPERPSSPPIQTPTGEGTGPGSGTPPNGGGGGGESPLPENGPGDPENTLPFDSASSTPGRPGSEGPLSGDEDAPNSRSGELDLSRMDPTEDPGLGEEPNLGGNGGESGAEKPLVKITPENELAPGPKQRFGDDVELAPNTKYELADTEGHIQHLFITDENGEIREIHTSSDHAKARNPELLHPRPNAKYVVDDRFTYLTDNYSRTTHMQGTLTLEDANARSNQAQRIVTNDAKLYYSELNDIKIKEFEETNGRPPEKGELDLHDTTKRWNAGHLAGSSEFGGAGEKINLTGMLETVNQSRRHLPGLKGSFRNLEKHWTELLEKTPGTDIQVSIDLVFDPSLKPTPSGIAAPPSSIVARWSANGGPLEEIVYPNTP